MSEKLVIKELLKQNRDLTDKLLKLSEMVINGPVPVIPSFPPPEQLSFPMGVTEEEEDAMHDFRTGAITKKELEDLLAQTEFESLDIDIMP